MSDVNLSVGQGSATKPLDKEADQGAKNFHGNLMNKGKDDSKQQKAMRMAAMKRRMAKGY